MTNWKRHDYIETPKDRSILIKGELIFNECDIGNKLYPEGIITVVGYFDIIDDCYCLTDTAYYGPFIKPVEWCEIPN